jgi:nucleotide-binding universal stress UspA family protein
MKSEAEGSGTGRAAGIYRRVVVGIDDSAGGLAALQRAVSMARSGGAELVAVRSWDIGLPRHGGRRRRHRSHRGTVLLYHGVQQRIESGNLIRRAFQAATGGVPDDVSLIMRTPEGDPGLALTRITKPDGDVLVVGTEAGHRAGRLMHGSVSRYCSNHAQCPVVVVRAPLAAEGFAAARRRGAGTRRPDASVRRWGRRVGGLPMRARAGGRR